ncbi:ParB/RepB/Spo0J family partition protein [uncultured Sphingobium sp.]|uniref:ParB/RepB/Spo0J family partition protein n=1 Tax=uncultured Sphingobium sp. TaxID=316087 RepID=UPI00259AF7C7|nr:ParB/RepB/Spo0J family partition protein [uncultured Sphingobium sp.]
MPRAKKVAPVAPVIDSEAVVAKISGIDMIPLGRLMRAPENVRHTDKAVDVESLADDIAAHGLLQNLIGYRGDTDIDAAAIYIVGGGRRLQALDLLYRQGVIDHDFLVPVLLRAATDAIDLSLSENLAKRDMNPADEFLAFEALMKPGLLAPADLAKRFGFSERYVKQRLRLAALAPEILDAMRQGKLTIDAAQAYALSQDCKLQLKVFAAEEKKGSWGHGVQSIRSGIINAVMTTGDPLFKFVGNAAYEEKGGRYEDDLFGDADNYSGRKLIDPDVVIAIASFRADFQMARILKDAQRDHPATSDVILVPGLRLGKVPKPPKGYEKVDRPYYRTDVPSMPELRSKADEAGIGICGYAGVNHEGKLVLDEGFFVPSGRLAELIPAREEAPGKSDQERQAERRAAAIEQCRLFLAADKVNTAMKDGDVTGRRFWGSLRPPLGRMFEYDDIGPAYSVQQSIIVTQDEVDRVSFEDAEAEFERQEAAAVAQREAKEKADAAAAEAKAARMAEILAVDPVPAVILVDGIAHFRWESGAYSDERELDAGDDVNYDSSFYDDLEELLESTGVVSLTWATIDAFDADPHTDNAVAQLEEVQ